MKQAVPAPVERDAEYLNVNALSNAVDSLETAAQLIQRSDVFKWKWVAFAIHHDLYSFAVVALTRGNFQWVLSCGRSSDDDNGRLWKQGEEVKWWRSKRQPFPKFRGAYRIVWEETNEEPLASRPSDESSLSLLANGKLIGFWTAFARILDKRWMGGSVISRPVSVSDNEFRDIAWLTTRVRNDLQHFVPKYSGIEIAGIVAGTSAAIRVIEDLVFGTNAIWFRDKEQKERVRNAVVQLRAGLKSKTERSGVASQTLT
ncbi:MAG: hypothetical protein WA117_08055 [Verrucomicrobiia bacterium]